MRHVKGICPVCPEKIPAGRLLNYQCLGRTESEVGCNQPFGFPRTVAHTLHMSTKKIVQDLLQSSPEDVSLHDVAREIEFVAAVRQGLPRSTAASAFRSKRSSASCRHGYEVALSPSILEAADDFLTRCPSTEKLPEGRSPPLNER